MRKLIISLVAAAAIAATAGPALAQAPNHVVRQPAHVVLQPAERCGGCHEGPPPPPPPPPS